MRQRILVSGVIVVTSILAAGCSRSVSSNAGTGTPPPVATAKSRYDLANGCYALKSAASGKYAALAGGVYAASAAAAAQAEPLFLKPTALGKYLIFARNQSYMAVSGTGIGSANAPAEAADWTVDTDSAGRFTIFSASAGKALSVAAADGSLGLGDISAEAARFGFDPATGCSEYPEAQVNAMGTAYKGRGVNQPVVGWADVHQHVSATNFLGGGHYGVPFHRFGITQALANCATAHGPMGALDVVGNLLGGSPVSTHDTVGWPTFVDWPKYNSLSHEQMYYKWIERAYLAGMRILMNNVVENEALCTLESKLPGHDSSNQCNEMENAVAQIQTMHDMQDYIDAQQGGPGKGWFRIVDNPTDARRVINDGKLAVVMGIEISHLFNCKVTQVLGTPDMSDCDEAEIDKQLDRLYRLGVRQMFPVHEFDNSLGGNGIFDTSGVLNAGNFDDTKKFWATYDCPAPTDPSTGGGYYFDAGAIFVTTDPSGATNPVLEALLANGGGGVLPVYPGTPQCNARAITPLGTYAINKMMDKKVIVEVDHLELKMKDQVMDLAAARADPAHGVPPYPVVSTHGGFGGISNAQARRIYALGGFIYDSQYNAIGYTRRLKQLRTTLGHPDDADPVVIPMGYGADTNGLAQQADPRGAGHAPLVYPFTLFKGPEWSGPLFAGIAPITFDRQVTGERVYDSNIDGEAHYGLVADWVEEVKIEGGPVALNALYSSAEEYLRTWERTVNRP